jgi:cysteine-rich repeat protein
VVSQVCTYQKSTLAVFIAVVALACDGASSAPPVLMDDVDAGVGAQRDAQTTVEIPIGHQDASFTDAGIDAGLCNCPEPLPTCQIGQCVDGVCVLAAREDGYVCDEAGAMICVSGSCVVARCGDGYRDEDPREACDDGNDTGGDGCDPDCVPTPIAIAAGGPLDLLHAAIAVDGGGSSLVVWIALAADHKSASLLGRRLDANGIAIDAAEAPLTFASSLPVGADIEPSVAGLADGWVVAWSSPLAAAQYRRAPREGSLWPPRSLSATPMPGQERLPQVATLAAGFVAVWHEASSTEPGGDVLARRFDGDGRALGANIRVLDHGQASALALASDGGDRWAASWLSAPALGGPTNVAIARYQGGERSEGTLELLADARRPSVVWRNDRWELAWLARDPVSAATALYVRDVPIAGPWVSGVVQVSAHAADLDIALASGASPSLLRAWVDDAPIASVALTPASEAPPELPQLEDALRSSPETTDVELARAPNGTWILWRVHPHASELSGPHTLWAFLLPDAPSVGP